MSFIRSRDRHYPRQSGPHPICVLALVMGLSACTFAPVHERPDLPVPSNYEGHAVPSPPIADVGWQDFFRDAELQRLIGEALAHNRDIRVATARVAEARAAWRIEGASLYPQLDALGTGTRGRTLFSLPGTGAAPVETRQISAQLSAAWEIDFWGRLRNLRDAARSQYLATEEARRAVATDLVAQVANGYLLEREYTERIGLARASIVTREDALRIMRRRYEVGSGSKLDMAQAQILLAQARTTLQALEQERDINRNALSLLVGRPIEVAPGKIGLAEMIGQVSLPIGLPSQLLVHRPDVVAAEHQLRAANANIAAARAAFLPNISLTGAYGTMSDELDSLFSRGSEVWSFSPTITLPLFNAGRLKGNLEVAEARRERSVAEYERTIQSAFRDVSDALVRRRQLGLQIETARETLEAQRERARLAQLRFDNGRSAYLEVLDAQRDLFEAEQALVQLRRAEIASIVALYSALGGGFAPEQPFRADAAKTDEDQTR